MVGRPTGPASRIPGPVALRPMGSRPRDRYGRPLARDAVQRPFPGVPPRAWLTSAQAWHEAQAYLALDLPFHAHEVCELRWRVCGQDERILWRALAQWTAALTHAARGNAAGAAAVAGGALEALGRAPVIPVPVDATLVSGSCHALLREGSGEGPAPVQHPV